MKHKKGAMKREEDEQRIARLKGIVDSMTDKPGRYKFYDGEGNII